VRLKASLIISAMKLMAVRIAPLVLALFPRSSNADLPVHCLRHQVAGDWVFTLGPLGPKRSSCGHQRPDAQYSQPPLNFLSSQGATSTLRVSLQDPATASAEDGSTGSWTMIYDEGFEVALGDQVYFAFSNFEFVQDGRGGRTNVSHCGATQVGWYHNTQRTQWGCYVGSKVGDISAMSEAAQVTDVPPPPPQAHSASLAWLSSEESEDAPEQDAEAPMDPPAQPAQPALAQEGSDDNPATPDPFATPVEYKPWVPASNGYDQPMASQWQQTVADALNFLQLGWTAGVYRKFHGKTPRELNRFAGVRRHIPRPARQQRSEASRKFSSFLGLNSRIRRVSAAESFDWRSRGGQNWLEPVVTQGDCGSCYTISTVHMLTARNRIKQNNINEPSFSVSFPLYCSEYNQGCDGGYGFLQSKWSEDIGLVPESCAPFSQGGGSCRVTAECELGDQRYRAMSHHYVGGFYGGSTEESIRQELVSSGPVVMSFEPKEDFMYYKAGIYRSAPHRIHEEWEQVDHAVLLTGYGAEADQPFWTMQNSWGTDWGEQGYFRMARGTDESGCESIVVAADVAREGSNAVLEDFLSSL